MFLKFNNRRQGGFTLLELMVTLIILAILAAVAINYYNPFLNKSVCSNVEVTVHQAMLGAIKQLNDTGSAPTGEASTALGITYPDTVSSVVIGWSGGIFTVNGTATNNKCPNGTKYVLVETDSKGTWK